MRVWSSIAIAVVVLGAAVWLVSHRDDGLAGAWQQGDRTLEDGSDPRNGLSVGVRDSHGPEGATILMTAWPLGSNAPYALNGPTIRSYARDPQRVLASTEAVAFTTAPSLSSARDTGIHNDEWSIWIVPGAEDDYVWLWNGEQAERWPRLTDLSACA
jgi:hypothetical protein